MEKARVVSITIPLSKADFTFAAVLERRAHVPDSILISMGVQRPGNRILKILIEEF